MEETTNILCIACPKGCNVKITHEDGTVSEMVGASCKRGENYVQKELVDPRRMVATTVKVKDGLHPLVPVYTKDPVPKPRIHELLEELRQIELQAPVQGGHVILANALGEGIDVITSRDMPKHN